LGYILSRTVDLAYRYADNQFDVVGFTHKALFHQIVVAHKR